MEEISLRDIFIIIRRRTKLIVSFTIIGLVFGIVLSGVINIFFYTPEYQTYTSLMIKRGNNVEYVERLKSQSLSREVIKNLDLDMSVNTLIEKTSIDLLGDNEIIKLEVVGEDPILIATIANEMVEIFKRDIEGSSRIKNIQIIDRAQVQKVPINSKSNLKLDGIVGGILGFVLGLFMMFLLEYLDNTIKTPEDVEIGLDLPIIGAIPSINRKVKDENIKKSKRFMNEYPKSSIAEAFRILRTNIQYSGINEPIKSITISSSKMGEGSSFVSANLAIAMAKTKRKVLLIEGDLRKPSIYKYFNITNSIGLTSLLEQNIDYNDAISPAKGIDGLDIITSGPLSENPSEVLESVRMKDFLNEVKEKYDMVIIDTPPIGAVTDGAILSTIVDGSLLVCSIGETEIDIAKRAKSLLNKVNTNILGVVLNKIPLDKGSYYGYDYSDYYGDPDSDEIR